MTKKKINKTIVKQGTADKAPTNYGGPRIVFFNSFEEENAFTYHQRALIDPLENFKTVTAMIKRCFAKELKENLTFGNRIYFDTK